MFCFLYPPNIKYIEALSEKHVWQNNHWNGYPSQIDRLDQLFFINKCCLFRKMLYLNQLFKDSTTCKKNVFYKNISNKKLHYWNKMLKLFACILTSNASCLGLCIKNTPESKKSLCWVYTEALSKRRLFLCIKSTNMTIVHHQDNQPTASSDPSKASTFWEVWLPDSCDWVFLRVRRLRCKLRSRLLLVILQSRHIDWNKMKA